jgi:hypothetical protein
MKVFAWAIVGYNVLVSILEFSGQSIPNFGNLPSVGSLIESNTGGYVGPNAITSQQNVTAGAIDIAIAGFVWWKWLQ